jgi:uncharacterized protein YecT (DUF1311 family)
LGFVNGRPQKKARHRSPTVNLRSTDLQPPLTVPTVPKAWWKNMMVRLLGLVWVALLGAGGIAHAACEASSDAARAQCIGQELRASDQVINDAYAHLHDALDADGQAALRHQEIAWIRLRAKTCQVDARQSDREKWFADLLTDFGKTVCVVRFTDQRVAELRAQQAALRPAATAGAPPAQVLPPPAPSDTGDIYELVAQKMPASGKWYFEVTMDQSDIAKSASATIFIGVSGAGFGNVGTLRTVRKRNIGAEPVTIGIAFDLDDGKLYLRDNGAWQHPPGSAQGLDLKLGRPYQAQLSSSIPLNPFLADRGTPFLNRAAVDVNLGQRAFIYAVPDGYIPLDSNGPRQLAE